MFLSDFIQPMGLGSGGNHMPFFMMVDTLINQRFPFLSVFLNTLLILIQALYLNSVLGKNEMFTKKSNFILLFYPLIVAALSQYGMLTPASFVNLILIAIFSKILALYKNSNPLPLVFDAGLLSAIASLFFLPAIFVAIFIFISLFVLRPISWREWVVALMGFAVPYIIVSLYYFWNDGFMHFWGYILDANIKAGFKSIGVMNNLTIAIFCLISLLIILSINRIRVNYYKTIVRVRNYIQAVFILLFVACVSAYMSNDKIDISLQILTVPFAIIGSFFFIHAKRLFFPEFLLLTLIVLVVVNRYL